MQGRCEPAGQGLHTGLGRINHSVSLLKCQRGPQKGWLTEYDGHLSWRVGKHVKINTAWKPKGQRVSLLLLASMAVLENQRALRREGC